jgi:transposase
MSDKSLSAILETASHTEETKSFIKQVRRLTRRKFTPEEKIRIVLEGFRHEIPTRDLCCRVGFWHYRYMLADII